MADEKDAKTTNRRDFLKLAGASAPAALAAATGTAAEAGTAEPDAEGTGLRDTAHTRAYFDSVRF